MRNDIVLIEKLITVHLPGCMMDEEVFIMKVSELKARKTELGYTNEMVAELSGVPLGTIQKVFGGTTSAPRYDTLKKIEKALFPEMGRSCGPVDYDDVIRSSSLSEPVLVRESSNLAYYGYNNEAYAGKKQGEYTIDDLYALPDEVRMELIDGCLYDMAPPTSVHQYLAGQMLIQIENAMIANDNKHCLPLMSPIGVQLNKDKKNLLQPDVIVVCDKDKFQRGVVYGAPDFVAEVLSPSTAGYDRLLKLNKYWTAGVREYWIIDPKKEEIIAYCFEKGTAPVTYTFEDKVPLGISGGLVTIDFAPITARMRHFFG